MAAKITSRPRPPPKLFAETMQETLESFEEGGEEKDEEKGEEKDEEKDEEKQEQEQEAGYTEKKQTKVTLHPIEKFWKSFGECLNSVCCCFHHTIPDDYHADVVEFGRYVRTLGPGMHSYNSVTETIHLVPDRFVRENECGIFLTSGRFSKVVPPGQYHVNKFLNEELKIVPLISVPEKVRAVVTRCGKFHRILEPGQHFINPILKEEIFLEKEIIINHTQIGCLSKDGVYVKDLPPGKYFTNSILNEKITVVDLVGVVEGSVGLLTVEGRHSKVLPPGGYYPRAVLNEEITIISMQSITDELKPQKIVTKDTTSITTQSILVYRIVDPCKAHYGVKDLDFSIRECAKTITQQVLSEYDLDHIMKSKAELSTIIQRRVATLCERWGVEIQQVNIREIFFEKSLEADLAETAKARRVAEARRITAEADIEISKKMEKIYDSPGALSIRQLDTMRDICSAPNTRVLFIPGLSPLTGTSIPSSHHAPTADTSSINMSGMEQLPARVLERVIAREVKAMEETKETKLPVS